MNETYSTVQPTGSEERVTAQISHLIKILVDNLQTDPFAPVREYISNAHDATKGQKNPVIQVWAEFGKLHILDNGSGMTRKVILEAYTRIAGHFSRVDENETIGMFGIGVLSAFIAAEKLVVETRHADEPHGWRLEWARYAETFHLEPVEKSTIGTEAVLYLDDDAKLDLGSDKVLREYIRKTFGLFTTPIYVGRDTASGAVNQQWQWIENLFNGEEKLLNNDDIRRLMGQYFPQQKLLCAYFGKGPDGARVLLGIPQQESTFTADRHQVQFFSKGVRLMGNIRDFFPDNLSFVIGLIDSPNLKIQISREDIFCQDNHFQTIRKAMENHILRFFDMLAQQQPVIMEQALHIHKDKLVMHGKECEDLCGLFRDYYRFTTTNGQLRWREILPNAEKHGDERFIYYTADELNAIDLLHGSRFLTVFAFGPEQLVLKQIADCENVGLKDVATLSNSDDLADVPEPFRRFVNRIVPYLGKRGIRTVVFVNRPGEKETPAMFRIVSTDGTHKFADAGAGARGNSYSVDALMLNIANPIIGKLSGQPLLARRQLEKIADSFYQIAVLHSPFNDLKFSASESIIENIVDCLQFRIGATRQRDEYDEGLADCFMALPYQKEFDTVWNAVNATLSQSPYNWKVIRGDHNIQDNNLLDSIKKFVSTSRRFIADISGFNHNVLIEVGLMLENHPDGLLIICDEETLKGMPADLRGKLCLVYKSEMRQSEAAMTECFREKIKTFQAWIAMVGNGAPKTS